MFSSDAVAAALCGQGSAADLDLYTVTPEGATLHLGYICTSYSIGCWYTNSGLAGRGWFRLDRLVSAVSA